MTYMLTNSSGMTTGLHCNYFVHETLNQVMNILISIYTRKEFPYLRDFSLSGTDGRPNHLLILMAKSQTANIRPYWMQYKDVTTDITVQLDTRYRY